MDIHLAAAADALQPRTGSNTALPEDAYYAAFAWSPSLPAWVTWLLGLVRSGQAKAPQHAPVARHA